METPECHRRDFSNSFVRCSRATYLKVSEGEIVIIRVLKIENR
jgi:hypothetical protein